MNALGMIETKGMIPAVEALDSILKAAEVRLISYMKAGAGLTTVVVEGDVGAVKAAVDAGAAAVRAINPKALKSENVIPRPDDSVSLVLKRGGKKKASQPKAPDPDPSPDNGGGAPKAEVEESEVISADNQSENVENEEAEAVDTENTAEAVTEASDSSEEKTPETTEEAEDPAPAEPEVTEEVSDTEEQEEIPESSAEEAAVEAEAETESEPEAEAEVEAEPEPEVEAEAETEPEPEAEAEVEAEPEPEVEAEVETEPEPEAETEVEDEPEPEADEVQTAELPQVKDRESIDQIVALAGVDALENSLEDLRVSELRKLARGYNGFSLTGRDISKANKKMLIDAFKYYYK